MLVGMLPIKKLILIALAGGYLCLASSAIAGEKRVLGKLGQAIQSVGIHTKTSTQSRTLYRIKKSEYLVVKSTKFTQWLGVVLQNGRTGYVPSRALQVLPYEVTQEASANRPGPSLSSRSGAAAVAGYSLNFIGTPYKWGGNDPNRGIDCSGFVKNMFGKIGFALPRTASEQALVGQKITRLEDLRAGDRLYFWETKRHKVGHTGIYLGNGYFVHSSVGRHGVNTSYLTKNWLRILVAARR